MAGADGFVTVGGFRVGYSSFGDSKRVLVCLHGGPGTSSGYLGRLAELSGRGVRVVLYDQVGCGASDHPEDHSVYRIGKAAEQLDGVLDALGLDRVSLLGHSYGGFLALEYALGRQDRLESLVLSSSAASVPATVREMAKLKDSLPDHVRMTMAKFEAAGDLQNPEYLRCIDYIYHRHLCILDPWPPEMEEVFRNWSQDIYREMWGTNEFVVTGNLRDWDVSGRLVSIALPTLITVGRYDELPLPLSEQIRAAVTGSRLKVFERSSHMAMLEEPQAYTSAILDFLSGLPR